MFMFEKHALEKCTSLNSNNLLYANLTYESGILNRFSRILYLYTFCYTQPVICLLHMMVSSGHVNMVGALFSC